LNNASREIDTRTKLVLKRSANVHSTRAVKCSQEVSDQINGCFEKGSLEINVVA